MNTKLLAITHLPSPALADCLLTYIEAQPIDVRRARDQHAAYRQLLVAAGAEVCLLTGNEALPDSVFVEDTAVILPELAIITPMGAAARRGETALIAATLAAHRPLATIPQPAQLEGGDVLRVGRTIFVGQSTRSDAAGLAALAALVTPHGYRTVSVPVHGCLHLKTACTALDERTLLVNPAWIDTAPLAGYDLVPVPAAEPFAANTLRLGETICLHAGFAATRRRLQERGYRVATTDISEFLKAEAGLTCMSLLLTAD